MKFKKTDLQELVGYDEPEGFEVISNEIYDTSRWSNYYELIFKYGVLFYKTTYSCGATEMQDESPFEYEGEYIDCIEVRPVERTIIVYEPVSD